MVYLETIRTVDAIQGASVPTAATSTLMETSDPSTSQMDTSAVIPRCNTLVKSKSLEDLVRAIKSIDGSLPSHEMEFMSSRIQKLKVQE